MKVQCLFDNLAALKKNSIDFSIWVSNINESYDLIIGNEYTVLAISKIDNKEFYYLIGEDSDDYPLPYPKILFKITDTTISNYWVKNSVQIESLNNGDVFSFPEWVREKEYFYEKLLEEDEEIIKIFESYKDKILSE